MSKHSKVNGLGFNRLKFEEEPSFSRASPGESPIGFSNRLVEIGQNQPVNSQINKFRVKYISNCNEKGTASVLDKIRITDIMKMESIIQKHDSINKSAYGQDRRQSAFTLS